MSSINCVFYPDEIKYILNFRGKRSFDSEFIITCPDGFQYKEVTCYDGFLFGIIFAAMEDGEDLHTDLPVSFTGLQNLHYFIEAWHNLMPRKYNKIKIIPSNVVCEKSINNQEGIVAFSGGVDSCFSLLRHNEEDWGRGSFYLKSVLGVHGFDIPMDAHQEYDELMGRVGPIFQQYDCKQFNVWTDIKFKSEQDWEMSHANQLAACMHLFSEHFGNAIIGSTESYETMFLPWGSSPATDYLLSSNKMTMHHDGAGYSRTEKVERIAKNELVRKYLKVCWENGAQDNCGECEKCYRTRFNFIASGYPAPACFEGGLI